VISRNSTFAYKGKALRIRDIGAELGAEYVLEGTVRKFGRQVRITTQLVDAATDRQAWSARQDGDLNNVLELQDEVVSSIVNALAATDGVIEKAARRSSLQRHPNQGTAYDYYLQAREQFYRPGDQGFDKAQELYEKAIEADPSFARAYSALAWLHFLRFKSVFRLPFERILPKALELALESARLDPNDYRAHWVLGCLYMHQRKHSQALAQFERALRINPNDANLLMFSADALVYGGRTAEALERCYQAIRISPNGPDWHW
jgi:adenylate cyclase